jgi:hypothetical protein
VSIAAAGAIRLPARPVLACTFARNFARWMSSSVAALAKHHLGQPVVAIETGPGYVCRGGNGALERFSLERNRRIPARRDL